MQPYPPVQIVEVNPDKNNTFPMLLSQCSRRLQSIGLTMKLTSVEHRVKPCVYKSKATLSIESKDDDVELVKLQSYGPEVKDIDNARKAAYKELKEECIRLGFLQLK